MNAFMPLIGQTQAVELLNQAVKQQRIAPAYLFAGSGGIGRSLAARCFCQLLLGYHLSQEKQILLQKRLYEGNYPDLFWVEPTYLHQGQRITAKEAETTGLKRQASPQIRIEQIREIAQFLARPPLESPRSVVIIEAAQMMSEASANALLKTLEEPGRATLVLIAPSTDSLLPTLVSRCQRIPFVRLSQADLKKVLQIQGYDDILKYPELLAIAQGSPGNAIAAFSLLQEIPPELLQKLTQPPKKPLHALLLAKEVEQQLENSTQLWLIDYLQSYYWQHWQQKKVIEVLEKARQSLLSYVNARLVWEVTLLSLCQK
jgi:DNA polymerase-3 subunit delta'